MVSRLALLRAVLLRVANNCQIETSGGISGSAPIVPASLLDNTMILVISYNDENFPGN